MVTRDGSLSAATSSGSQPLGLYCYFCYPCPRSKSRAPRSGQWRHTRLSWAQGSVASLLLLASYFLYVVGNGRRAE
jgi:hypothetical protein